MEEYTKIMDKTIEHWLEFENDNGDRLLATPAVAHNKEGKQVILDFMRCTEEEIGELIEKEGMRIERKLPRNKSSQLL